MEPSIRRNGRIVILFPFFIRRKAEEKEKSYYYVGSAVAVDDAHESVNIAETEPNQRS